MLWTYERVMFGPITKAVNETIRDLTGREIAVMVPVIALMLFMGLFPRPLISRMEPSVTAMLARANFAQAQLEPERHAESNELTLPALQLTNPKLRRLRTMSPFNLAAINFVWLPILPMVIVAVAAIVVLLAGVRVDDSESEGLGLLTLASLGVAFVFTLGIVGQNGVAFAGAISIDSFSAFFELVILIAAMFTVMMSLDYAAENQIPGAEYYSLLLFSALGMMLMATAGDLIVIFLGLETMSITVYVLAGMMRRNPKSNEAAIKYFLLGAFSTGFLLYGIALVYGATGSIKLGPIHDALASGAMSSNPLLLLGIGMMVIGFGFKVAAVPFHMWTPDVYEGAPTPVTAFMAVGVKLAAFAAFVRVFLVDFRSVGAHWQTVLWVVAALTMTGGNLIAVVQTNIKRMLAYSAIAHAGYLLLGMAAGVQSGPAILYYLLGYAFTNLGRVRSSHCARTARRSR